MFSHLSGTTNTSTHARTLIPGTTQQYLHGRLHWLAAITAAASRRKSAWHIPSSARQQRVYRTMAAARGTFFANNGHFLYFFVFN